MYKKFNLVMRGSIVSALSVACLTYSVVSSGADSSLSGLDKLSVVTSGTLAKINSNTAVNTALAAEEAAKAKYEKAKEDYLEAAHKISLIKSGKSSTTPSPVGGSPFMNGMQGSPVPVFGSSPRAHQHAPEIISLSGFRGVFTAELSTGTGSVINVRNGSVIRHGWVVKSISPGGIDALHNGKVVSLAFQNNVPRQRGSASSGGGAPMSSSMMPPPMMQSPIVPPPNMNAPSMPPSSASPAGIPQMFGGAG